jgi:hypothetical protein
MHKRFLTTWLAIAAASAAFLALAVGYVALQTGSLLKASLVAPDFAEASRRAWSFLVFCIGVAGLTTAFVQIVRTLIPIRGYFHRYHLIKWLDNGASSFDDDLSSERPLSMLAIDEFERLGNPSANAAWGRRPFRERYDLPLEQLTGQLSLALEAALDSPDEFAHLLRCVFGPRSREQLNILEMGRRTKDATADMLLTQAEARSALTRLAQLRIDAFQIMVGGLWRRYLRIAVVCVSLTVSAAITSASLIRKPAETLSRDRIKSFATFESSDSSSEGEVDHAPRGNNSARQRPRLDYPRQQPGSNYPFGSAFSPPRQREEEEREYRAKLASVILYSLVEGLSAAFLAMVLRDLFAIVENKRRQT